MLPLFRIATNSAQFCKSVSIFCQDQQVTKCFFRAFN